MEWFNARGRMSGRQEKGDSQRPLPVERLLSYQVANLQGIGTRSGQEDSFAFVNAMDVTEIKREGLLAVMADGMGGMQDGKRVSEAAIAYLMEAFCGMDRRRNLGGQLKESLYQADDILYGQFGGAGGTTMVACIFYQGVLYFASVGDSYLYLKRGNGIYRMNKEQTYRQELYLQAIENGLLCPEQADKNPDAPRLSEFIGSGVLKDVDALIRPWILKNGDVVLLCSDGVGGVLTEQELLVCLDERTPGMACERMEQKIQEKGRVHQDNYTALVVACKY